MSTENEVMDTQPELVHADSPSSGPGDILRRAREQAGLTIAEVAIQLHLSRNVIEALEADQYSKLAAITFAKGYLRSYAKLLKMDEDDIIQRFAKLNIAEPERAPTHRVVVKEVKAGDRPVKWISYAIVLALGGLVIVWWHNHTNSAQSQIVKPMAEQAATVTLSTDNQTADTTTQSTAQQQINTTVNAATTAAPNTNSDNASAAATNTTTTQAVTPTVVAKPQKPATVTQAPAATPASTKVNQNDKHFSNWKNPDLN